MFSRLRRWFSGHPQADLTVKATAAANSPTAGEAVVQVLVHVPPPRDSNRLTPRRQASPTQPATRPGIPKKRRDDPPASAQGQTVSPKQPGTPKQPGLSPPSGHSGPTGRSVCRPRWNRQTRQVLLATLSQRERRWLQQAGLTPRQLLLTAPDQLARMTRANELSPTFARRISQLAQRTRWAFRFAGRFDDMSPRQALILRAVHRGNLASLAIERPGLLRRDLQRLAYSSAGRRWLTLQDVPAVQQIRSWIDQAGSPGRTASKRNRDSAAVNAAAGCPNQAAVRYNARA